MANFTQGTWVHNPATGIVSAHTLLYGKNHEQPVATVLGAVIPNPIVDNSQALANARLIENAPVMFDKLDTLIGDYWENLDTCPELRQQIVELLNKIRPPIPTDTIQLTPCPFCGCEAPALIHYYPQELFYVECPCCQSTTRPCDTADDAIDAWQNRSIA